MRFMIIRKADATTEAGVFPTGEKGRRLFEAMTKYHEEMAKAGILLGGDGLKPSSQGARVIFRKGKPKVVDGPFAETKELVGGYSIIQVGSLAEAIEWVKKWPIEDGDVTLEIRPFYEAEDFPAEIVTPELLEREQRIGLGAPKPRD